MSRLPGARNGWFSPYRGPGMLGLLLAVAGIGLLVSGAFDYDGTASQRESAGSTSGQAGGAADAALRPRSSPVGSSTDLADATKPPATNRPASGSSKSRSWLAAADSESGESIEAQVADPVAMERRLLESVRYLASDELEGRGLGTKGIELAADYLASEFRGWGLRTDLYAETPFHVFSRSARFGMNGPNTATIRGPDGAVVALELNRDFRPLSLSGSTNCDAPLVFAGYGITAPELEYDDYSGLDARGKVVLVLRNEPQQASKESRFAGTQLSDHGYVVRKVANAMEHGAAAIVLCSDIQRIESTAGGEAPAAGPERESWMAEHDSLLGFTVRGADGLERKIPVLHVHRSRIEPLLANVEGGLEGIERAIDNDLRARSRALDGWSMQSRTSVGTIVNELKNVVASLDAKGPLAEETVVVGAHYDHLGYGGGWGSLAPWTREVHNGADDNASGTTVMLEVARQLAARSEPLRRRVLFIGFTAEESGLIGSEHYVSDPYVPLSDTVAMVNLDMVGYLRNDRMTVHGTGTAETFNALIDQLAPLHRLRVTKDPSGYGPSDHASFASHNVPVLHLFTGFHDHYHRPSDDFDRLNIEGMRRIAQFTTDIVVQIANADSRPGRAARRDVVKRRRPTWDDRVASQPRAVSLGLEGVPDPEMPGFRIQKTVKWGAAEQCGLRTGDLLLRIGETPVRTQDEISSALGKLSWGDRVTVDARRGSIELEMELHLDPENVSNP